MSARVVVVGGGYGGASVARALDPDLDVVLVEPKDALVHASAALRAVVDPEWLPRVFHPYDHLLSRGRVVRDRARRVTPSTVWVSPTESIDADFVVLATGVTYPFPGRFFENDSSVATTRLTRLREALLRTDRALIVGGGPVGLELAGELTSGFPELQVAVVDKADDVLTVGDYLPELRDAVREQLVSRGVELITGAPLAYLPPVDVGIYQPFTVDTRDRIRIDAQIWFRCHGAQPVTDYLDEELATARRADGHIRVTEQLNVVDHERVFAIGDITDVPESKRASAAAEHAAVVARNILDLAAGGHPVTRHVPGPDRIILPLGPTGGAGQVTDDDGERIVIGADETSRIKGADLSDATITELFGQA
jgi:NADH dehydrogenase FAD-containing subunit